MKGFVAKDLHLWYRLSLLSFRDWYLLYVARSRNPHHNTSEVASGYHEHSPFPAARRRLLHSTEFREVGAR